MQYDMHYYGTYAMAAAAGIPKEDAEVIAMTSQFVDDHNTHSWVLAKSGEGIHGVATAHHPLDAGVRALLEKADEDDSRLVWVPFHFLPGNEGETFEERMVAQKDSRVVNTMLDFYLSPATLVAHKSHALQLMGIAAHVYADTFSHYGFSGMPSSRNLVKTDSIRLDETHSAGILAYIERRKKEFEEKWGQMPRLGHGGVLTHPDRPYLKWSFVYENGDESRRVNPDTFLEGCKALHGRFIQFGSEYYGTGFKTLRTWDQLRDTAGAVLVKEGEGDQRVGYWMEAMRSGLLGIQPCSPYDFQRWAGQINQFAESQTAGEFLKSDTYKFFAAADYHRGYVLKRLLPSFDLMVA